MGVLDYHHGADRQAWLQRAVTEMSFNVGDSW